MFKNDLHTLSVDTNYMSKQINPSFKIRYRQRIFYVILSSYAQFILNIGL